jgi:chromosome segregation ATPase
MGKAPVGHTCPDINRYIRDVRSLQNNLGGLYGSENESDFHNLMKDCDDIEDHFESIRRDNDSLRTWGYEEAERADKAEERANKAEEEVEELNSYIRELEARIKELEDELESVQG